MSRMAAEHAVKHLIVGAQLAVQGIGKKVIAPPAFSNECASPIQQRQPLRFLHGKLPEKSLMDEGEDGGVGADSQPDREQGDEGEGSIPQESAQSVLDVVG